MYTKTPNNTFFFTRPNSPVLIPHFLYPSLYPHPQILWKSRTIERHDRANAEPSRQSQGCRGTPPGHRPPNVRNQPGPIRHGLGKLPLCPQATARIRRLSSPHSPRKTALHRPGQLPTCRGKRPPTHPLVSRMHRFFSFFFKGKPRSYFYPSINYYDQYTLPYPENTPSKLFLLLTLHQYVCEKSTSTHPPPSIFSVSIEKSPSPHFSKIRSVTTFSIVPGPKSKMSKQPSRTPAAASSSTRTSFSRSRTDSSISP